jgi:hypothetical protein
MDMVGGGLETKAVFHVTRGPMSLPSFVHDVAWAFADWVNEESYEFAAADTARYPLIAPEGGKEPLRAEYSPYSMGSDHDVYQDSSFGIPAIYLNDWPDRYIHTNFDTAANIDTTKLKRAAFIGAASGYFLANFSSRDVGATTRAIAVGKLLRAVMAMRRNTPAGPMEEYERGVVSSLDSFDSAPGQGKTTGHAAASGRAEPSSHTATSGQRPRATPQASRDGTTIFRRRPEPRGPLSVFGYDYFADHAKTVGIPTPGLLSYEVAWGGEEAPYAYEALNFADGKHTTRQIAEELSAEFGAVPPELVAEYLRALKSIGVVD